MNKDQVKSRIEEVKGKAKEVTGKIGDDKEVEGRLSTILRKAAKASAIWTSPSPE